MDRHKGISIMCTGLAAMDNDMLFRAAGRHKTGQQGFTLVEMLIALVLSSVIFFSSYQVISNLIQYQVRARVKNVDELDKLLLENLLSQIIEQSMDQNHLYDRVQKKSVFKGRTGSLQLVSRAYSDRYDIPGYRVYRLYQNEGELFVSYQAFDKDYSSNKQFQLATGIKIKDLGFEYLEQNEWTDEWGGKSSFPKYIRIKTDLPGAGPTVWIKRTSRR